MSRVVIFLVFFILGPPALLFIFAAGAVMFGFTLVFVWASLCWYAADSINQKKTIPQVLSDWKNRRDK